MATGVATDFAAARRRLQHAGDLRKSMLELHERDSEAFGMRANLRAVGNVVEVVVTYAPDPMLATVFGSWLASVRTALDQIFYQLAIHETQQNPPTRKGERQFPVCLTPEAFDGLFHGNRRPMQGFSDRMVAAIRGMQPFNGKYGADGDAIAWFDGLAKSDRHRDEHEMGGRLKTYWARVSASDSHRVIDGWRLNRETELAVVSAERDLVCITLTCRTPDDAAYLAHGRVEVDVRTNLEVCDWFREAHQAEVSQNIRNDTLGERMGFVEYFMGLIIDEFEKMTASRH